MASAFGEDVMNGPVSTLEMTIGDELFPEVDIALRSGRHVGSDDLAAYEFLRAAQQQLEPHYRRWGLELTFRPEGYFFLAPARDAVRRRQLTHAEMMTGQTLALLSLEPAILAAQGTIRRTDVLRTLASLVGEEKLMARLNPRKKQRNERVDQDALRAELHRATRTLAELGFCTIVDDESVRVRPAIMRFADLARGPDRAALLEKLISRAEVSVESDVDAGTEEAS